jgi:asparagine synthase (glutamine-hydrolysing)
VFKTHCDTEVIIHGYEEWGKEVVKKFIGMFAFAVWDNKKKTLWIARDRLGIKPLYYHFNRHCFVCSSEIKPLLASGIVRSELNEKVLDSYFSLGYVPGAETMFKGILKLEPGHQAIIYQKQLKIEQYWDFCNVQEQEISFADAKQKVSELMHDSIRRRLMSDVPLGVFLSGGLDSSAVVSVMSELVKDPINTFTASYDKKYKVGEESFAQIVADRFQTKHQVFRLEPDNFFSSMEQLVNFSEEPIVESAGIALYHLSKMAKSHATVLLSGEGSDEIFGGYPLYYKMMRIQQLHQILPAGLLQPLAWADPLVKKWKHSKYLTWLTTPVKSSYQGTSSYLTKNLKKRLYNADIAGDYLTETFAGLFNKVTHKKDFLNALLYVDTKTWLPNNLLVKADKMSMAASIELRVPFLDHRLVELCSSLPASHKIRNGSGKYILKEIMADKLPPEIIDRKKMGFPVPTKSWLSGELFGEVRDLLSAESGNMPWFKKAAIEGMLADQKNGKEDHSKLLLMMVIFLYWRKRFAA